MIYRDTILLQVKWGGMQGAYPTFGGVYVVSRYNEFGSYLIYLNGSISGDRHSVFACRNGETRPLTTAPSTPW